MSENKIFYSGLRWCYLIILSCWPVAFNLYFLNVILCIYIGRTVFQILDLTLPGCLA